MGRKQAETTKSSRIKTTYKYILFLRKIRSLKQDFKVTFGKTLEDNSHFRSHVGNLKAFL